MTKKSEKIKIPKLRFSEFEGEWDNPKLHDIAKVTSGGTPNRQNADFWNGNIPWVTTSLIDFNHISKSNEYITQKGLKNSSAKLFSKNTLLMALYGQGITRGKIAILDIEATTNQECAAILLDQSKANVGFSFFHLQKKYKAIRDLSNDGGQKNLSGGLLKNITISLPTLPEQEKIATFLSAVDKKIQQLTRKKELLAQYKKGVMQRIFAAGKNSSVKGKGKSVKLNTDFAPIRFKDENGNDYLKWEERKLGDVLIFISTNSLSRKDLNYKNGEIKNIHYGDIHTTFKMGFDSAKENVPYINPDIDLRKIREEQFCQEGDVVIADASEDYADIGKAIEIWNTAGEKILSGLHTFLGRDLTEKTENGFKGYLFQSKTIRNQIKKMAQGISVLGISKKNIAKIEFELPCNEEQKKIASFLSNIDKKIESMQNQLTKTQAFKKGLLQQMFV